MPPLEIKEAQETSQSRFDGSYADTGRPHGRSQELFLLGGRWVVAMRRFLKRKLIHFPARDNDNDNDHSFSQLSVHKPLTCPEAQSAWALALALSGERKTGSVQKSQISCHVG